MIDWLSDAMAWEIEMEEQVGYMHEVDSQYKWPVFPVGSVLSPMVLGLISWNIEIELLKFFLSLN